MIALNHALTGAVVSLVVKRPELAIPLAFLSHFVVDMVPHYNPAGVKGVNKLKQKLTQRSFRWIFAIDMITWPLLLIGLPLFLVTDVSPWTIFFCILGAVSPDFIDGYYLFTQSVRKKIVHPGWFARFSVAIQTYEKPPGLIVEIAWGALMIWLVSELASI